LSCGDPAGIEAVEFVGERLSALRRPVAPEEFSVPWATVDLYAQAMLDAERDEESERAFRWVRGAADEAGAVSALSAQISANASLLIRAGRFQEVLDDVARCEQLLDLYPGAMRYPELHRALTLLWLGRTQESDVSYERARAGAVGLWMDELYLETVRGLRLLWAGQPDASEHFLRVEELTRASGIFQLGHLMWSGYAVDAHLAVGRETEAARVVAWLHESAGRPGSWPRISCSYGGAVLASFQGQHDKARELFREALGALEGRHFPLVRIEILLAYGRHLRRRGRLLDARAPLGEAHRLADGLGAAWMAETAGRELTAAGGRRRRVSEDRDQLTPAERRVADLAAEGLTNGEIARRLFLSVNTIETHLRRIYSKLGIRSRKELIRFDRDFTPPAPR
jgi:DNA-binding CsgD family transcriptional regulator